MTPGLLDGLRVLELGGWRPVNHATQLLADLGADVVKIEPPGGDPMRNWPGLFERLHAGKRSQVRDLRDDGDRAAVLALADGAEVVIEGWRPGVAGGLGVGPDAVRGRNSAVVYCSLSGYGQTGPLAQVPGHDLNYQAWGGALVSGRGGPPVQAALPVADLAAGQTAAFAICAALVGSRQTGRGEHLDIGMADVMVTWAGVDERIAYADEVDAGEGEGEGDIPGYGLHETADGGWVALGIAVEDRFWTSLCDVLGLDDVRDVRLAERLRRREPLSERVREAVASWGRDEVVDALLAVDVPVSPVLRPSETPDQEQFRVRDVVTTDTEGRVTTGFPGRLADHPPRAPGRAPTPGQHQDEGWRPR